MIVTLTTDFGTRSPYVAAMKGALLRVNPAAAVHDLTHAIAPQNLREAALFLESALPWFPPDALHVVVVDPGVGSDRAILHVTLPGGLRLLAPDNGCWTWLPGADTPATVRRLAASHLWHPRVSPTFHGRDVFAPVAGHLSRGLDPERLGPVTADWHRLPRPESVRTADGWRGEVLAVDGFGNLISNIPSNALTPGCGVAVGGTTVARVVRTYADAPTGALVALASSADLVEVAVVGGSAAARLGVAEGGPVGLLPAAGR